MDAAEHSSGEMQNIEHSNINGSVPVENYLNRSIIVPAYAQSDLNPVHVLLCDKDVFDCSICSETLSFPIFQCFNGHIVCDNCFHKIKTKCAICSMPFQSRCLAIEKIMESIKIGYVNATYGCSFTMRLTEKNAHENTCKFEPCMCPQVGCNFFANSKELAFHFRMKHVLRDLPFIYGQVFSMTLCMDESAVVLQAHSDSKLFVVNNTAMPMGHILTLCHVGPNTLKPEFYFEMLVRSQQGCKSLLLKSEVENHQNCASSFASSFLLVPLGFLEASQWLMIEIRISVIDVAESSSQGNA